MFDSLGSFLQTLLAVASITALAGVGFQRARFNEQKASLGEAREEIADKERRLHEAEDEIRALKTGRQADLNAARAQRESDAIRIQTLEKNIVDLAATVSSDQHWVEIGTTLREHHDEARRHWDEDERLLSLTAGELGAIKSGVAAVKAKIDKVVPPA